MGIEKAKFEKTQILEKKEKSEARKKLEEKLRTMTVWSLISLSSLGVGKFLFQEERKPGVRPETETVELEKKQDLSEIEKAELQKKLNYLKNKFGERITFQLEQSAKKNEEVKSKPIKVKNFDKIGLSNEKLTELWSEKYYPKGWVDEEVSRVSYSDKKYKMSKKYGIDMRVAARSGGWPWEDKAEIIFQKISFPGVEIPGTEEEWNTFIETLDWHFSHELSHANDWENEARTGFKSRVEFLYEVANNCFTEGAFHNSYIDSIKNKNKNKENYLKAKEHWATVCDHYFTMPDIFKEVYPKEFEMVDKYVKKEDPTFDSFKKKGQREELIKEIVQKK